MCFFIPSHTKLCLICMTLHIFSQLPHVHGHGDHDHTISPVTSPATVDNNNARNRDNKTQYSKTRNCSDNNMHNHNDFEIDCNNRTKHLDDKQYKTWMKFYINQLFSEYGKNGIMTGDGLFHLFENLGFDHNVLPKHSHKKHSNHEHSHLDRDDLDHNKNHHDDDHDHNTNHNGDDLDLNTNHHGDDLDTHHHSNDHDELHQGDHESEEQSNKGTTQSSTSASNRKKRDARHAAVPRKHPYSHEESTHVECEDFFEHFDIHSSSDTYSSEDFLKLCPGIVYTLSEVTCNARHSVHQEKHDHLDEKSVFDIPAKVWGYAILSILIISLVGLLGVAVIPIMQKVFYNHLLQFLVALAVGALAGDAMLHLLPHALLGDAHDHSHSGSHSEEEETKHREAVFKGLCGLLGIFFFFFMERVLSIITDMKRKRKKRKSTIHDVSHPDETALPLTPQCAQMRLTDSNCRDQIMGIHPGQKALTNYAESSQKRCSEQHLDENKTMVDEEDPSAVLTHNHHGHSHSLPSSVSAIAWMVILGDGIHNFSDGLAIGTAYANSMTGGVSTTIAVFCHELPHEIGDFAVLLRAGMSIKQAIMYNCVSSILAFMGVLVGVAIGNIGAASLWIFVCIAGMFLYIALVDMLPELMSVDTKKGEHPFWHLILQMVGMLLGTAIMFTIALYEKQLQTALDD